MSEGQKALNVERMTCWVPSCKRSHLLFRDGGGWWWCWRHWRSHRLSTYRILPFEVRW